MVRGLQRFVDYFRGFEDSYILIGGAACDVWLTEQGLSFRATKDLDLVLIVEAMTPGFFERFLEFIRAARYGSHQKGGDRPVFYRFCKPVDPEFPYMIELLCRNHLDLPAGFHLTPLPAGEDISSLSAILLDEAYYGLVVGSRTLVSGVPIVPGHCLIPLKAKAWLDLTARRDKGDDKIKGDDIKKHRNDVFRLYRAMTPASRFSLPDTVRDDLRGFLDRFPSGAPDWADIRSAVGKPELPDTATILNQLGAMFGLGLEASP
jgi:hypothetical protein